MNRNFDFIINKSKSEKKYDLDFLSIEKGKEIIKFHESFDMYEKTPLRDLSNLAKELGVEKVFVKDESYRFNLNAFKVLGGSYAIGKIIAEKAGIKEEDMSFESLKNAKEKVGELTFVTATDGNHGRGIAWAANTLGYKSVVYMPKGSSPERLANIKAENSDASITDLNYDDAVRLAAKMAEEKGWIMVQDTAWEGYEEIPTWIIQGYMTLGYETYLQLEEAKEEKPTHIFIQAGVGSLATAVCGFFTNAYQDDLPKIVVVEPNEVDCLYQTAKANDGELHFVTGNLETIMAGLACGEPCTIAWDVLKDHAHSFITCPDYAAADGMRVLAAPLKDDKIVVSGESGAAPLGCMVNVINDEKLKDIKDALEINEKSRLLFVNSEGDTDKENYTNVVWYGKYSKYCD